MQQFIGIGEIEIMTRSHLKDAFNPLIFISIRFCCLIALLLLRKLFSNHGLLSNYNICYYKAGSHSCTIVCRVLSGNAAIVV